MLDAKRSPRVLDLGANIGLFGAYVLSRWPGSSIESFEPDPANLRLLRRVVATNALAERWLVRGVAVADRDGEMGFAAGLFADAHLTSRAEERTSIVGVVDLFVQDHRVDLLKMDIEGGEWAILSDARLRTLAARALVLEWHAHGCPGSDGRDTAVRLLAGAGYDQFAEVERGRENGLLWAWRKDSGLAPSDAGHAGRARAPAGGSKGTTPAAGLDSCL
jgi:FkbM family methyltransferase